MIEKFLSGQKNYKQTNESQDPHLTRFEVKTLKYSTITRKAVQNLGFFCLSDTY